ncbi:MAG: hypothetical protein VCE91_14945 [Nitrospinota bacterium]
MDMLIFILILGGFILFKRLPDEQRKHILLRLEYELHKRGFIEYRD